MLSALIVRVPEAESHVGELRARFDPSMQRGVPAHVTLLYPFMAPERLDAQVMAQLQTLFNDQSSFAFRLERIGRFPATAYLEPEPGEPFVALTQAIHHQFPAYPPNRGEFPAIIPHLTVANGDAAQATHAAEELRAIMRQRGPIHALCQSVTLIENSTGRWQVRHEFALQGPPPSQT